ncbi:MAG: PLP-dependent aspartate aminotransferase family protein [Bryobacteraceae bacterium]|nr:PLP-dependent transferase [Solibacteraceae bacterium]MCO5352540.1 PLP-dependent aspartate aminotransferase family protein [Bryobacteraceae bacterium]
MKIHTRAVHAGDRKKAQSQIPVSTPVHFAASWITEDTAELDRIFGDEQKGYSYSRYDNPTNSALEELMTSLEGGAGALATASGMAALEHALKAALLDRPKSVVCARDIYGATIKLLLDVLGPFGIETRFVDTNDLPAVARILQDERPGALLMETISNPLLRVGAIDEIARLCRAGSTALIVDNTFATPLLVRPLELGAHLVVHSTTKYLGGHGDTLGGLVVSDEEHLPTVRRLARVAGPVLGPMEAFLTMRGVKTFALRMERQCHNARALAAWLRAHPRVAAVYYPDDPAHPDAVTVSRLLPDGLFGGMLSFEIKGLDRGGIFAFLDRLRLIVKATSLGDVHTMVLHPWISSHRDVPLKQKERMGIRENLVRLSTGIEAVEDIISDLEQALA